MALAWQPADDEVELRFVRASGPGGQHVNKVSTAVQLRFDIPASRLPEDVKARLLARADQRIGLDGVLLLRAEGSRSQALNRAAALERLVEIVQAAWTPPKPRRATKPTFGSQQRRLAGKAARAGIKAGRGKVQDP